MHLAMVLAIFGNLGNRKSRKLFYRISVVILETIYDVIFIEMFTKIVTLAILAMAIDDFSIPFATNRKTKMPNLHVLYILIARYMYYNPARLPVKFGCIGSSLSSKIIYLKTNLKTDALHYVGGFL